MVRVGLLTSAKHSSLIPDDKPLLPLLEKAGFRPEVVVWSAPVHPLPEWIVVRSPWDYYRRQARFESFLDSAPSRFLNSKALLRWNLDKRYLRELEKAGVPVVPTLYFEKGSEAATLLAEIPWNDFVAKPTVSAGAFLTSRLEKGGAQTAGAVAKLLAVKTAMIQPFAREVQARGEVSLIYFNDGGGWELSHSVLKLATGADFRVQAEFGGSEAPAIATAEQKAVAEKTLAALPEPGLYARIDLIPWEGQWVLSEAELIEPQLFFRYEPRAAERFVRALATTIR